MYRATLVLRCLEHEQQAQERHLAQDILRREDAGVEAMHDGALLELRGRQLFHSLPVVPPIASATLRNIDANHTNTAGFSSPAQSAQYRLASMPSTATMVSSDDATLGPAVRLRKPTHTMRVAASVYGQIPGRGHGIRIVVL